jgi:protease I
MHRSTGIDLSRVSFINQEGVVDGSLVSSRKPQDIPAFNREVSKLFSRPRAKSKQAH